MISLIKSKRQRTTAEFILWLIIGSLALLIGAIIITDGFEIDYRLIFMVGFAGIATLGIMLNWGPFVPCTILGWLIFILLADPVSRSHEEAAFKDFVVPIMGAVFGAAMGLIYEWHLLHPGTSVISKVSENKINGADNKQSEKEHHEKT